MLLASGEQAGVAAMQRASNRAPSAERKARYHLGTSVGVYASLDPGASWTKLMTGLPTVPVYDLKVHAGPGRYDAASGCRVERPR